MASDIASNDFSGAPDAAAAHDPSHAARNRLVIALLLVSTFVVILNETIMSVAHAAPDGRIWASPPAPRSG